MAKSLPALVLLLLIATTGQAQSVFRIDSLPVQSIILDKGWTWHPGDNPEWAKTDFDDSKWEPIAPATDIDYLPQLKQAGLGWFRLRLKIDPKLANTIVRLQVNQVLASEVYLDGQRIATYGKVALNPDLVEAYNPSVAANSTESVYMKLGSKTDQVLAVRFALESNLYYARVIRINPCFQIQLRKTDSTQIKVVDPTPINFIEIGIFLILALLHLTFYSSFRSQIASLYFSYYCLFVSGYMLLDKLTPLYTHSVVFRMNVNFLLCFTYFFSIPALLTAIYRLFNYQNKKLHSVLIFFVTIAFCLNVAKVPGFGFFFWSYPIFLMLEVMRVSVVALRFKKAGARIILLGTIGYLLFTLAFVVNNYFDYNNFTREILSQILWHTGLFFVPISFTIFTAKEFAGTSISLEKKLNEVKQLSAEKEQILTTQNETLEFQVSERTAELNQSLNNLRVTQAQLIQKEKLASLGELTAGIAHEIQNPLNFVNNFSELSVDLAQELNEELKKSELDKTLIVDLVAGLIQNQEKINHHGKRASAIVKGMLEHSRITTGERQPTDINQLADEYLRLAYHGMKAKNNNFESDRRTVDYELIVDKDMTLVSVVPQEIGRVLLNLINNAFYAVNQRVTSESDTYQPKVIVSTKQKDNHVQISVQDNGAGIPAAIKDKIFQPFFTTKPTGEGTGLGLSLSYDIVTKGHGGTLEVESRTEKETIFMIKLPITT